MPKIWEQAGKVGEHALRMLLGAMMENEYGDGHRPEDEGAVNPIAEWHGREHRSTGRMTERGIERQSDRGDYRAPRTEDLRDCTRDTKRTVV